MTEDNSHAGQGPVLLDIGGNVGAVIVTMPAGLNGQEVEARPIAGLALTSRQHGAHRPDDSHSHDDGHGHEEGHSHSDDQVAGHYHLVHVGVVERPSPDGPISTAVFGELLEGTYELYLRPNGPVALTVAVVGGEVSTALWPL